MHRLYDRKINTLLLYIAINSIQLLKFLRSRSTKQSCSTATNGTANFVHGSMVWEILTITSQ